MRKKYKFLLVTIVLILASALGCSKVDAATFSMSSSESSVEPGESFTITLSSDGAGYVDLTCSNGELSESQVWVEGSASVTCTAAEEGKTVTVSASGVIADFTTGKDEDKSDSVSITINQPTPTPTPTPTLVATPEPTTDPEPPAEPEPTVEPEPSVEPEPTATPEPEKSSNANLGNLGITPNDFTGFDEGVTSYNVSVPYEVGEINVYAYKQEESQTITGIGSKSLSEGSNVFDIVVTAEDGTEKTYTITVIRLAKEKTNEPNINNNNETKIEIALASIQIAGVTLKEPFKPNVYEYTGTADKDTKMVVVNGSANVQDAIIDVDAPNEFKDGENIIKITVKEKNGDGKKVYTIKVNKNVDESKDSKENKIVPAAAGTMGGNNKTGGSGAPKETIIYCIGVAVVTALGILFAVIRYRKDRALEEEEEDEFDFVGDISAKEAMIDAAVATTKLAGVNSETAEEGATETRRRGKHF